MDDRFQILETERLRLRRIRSTDVAALVALWCDPEVTRFMGGPRDEGKLRDGLAEDVADPFAYEYDLWPVEEKASGEVIGHCGLLEKEVDGRDEIELVYVFAKSAWGNGYAAEIGSALRDHALREKGIDRLISLIEPENAASERVAQRIGMRMEREIVRPGGAVRRVYALEKSNPGGVDGSAAEIDPESVCAAIAAAAPAEATWSWDGRFDAALLEFAVDDRQAIRLPLESHLGDAWTSATRGSAPDVVARLIRRLGGLMPGQLLFTSSVERLPILYVAWWPWGNGLKISIRVGLFADASDVDVPAQRLKAWFGID